MKKYFLTKIKNFDNIILYNNQSGSGIVAFNISGVFAQDSSVYLNHYHIFVRAGNHCAKMLKDEIQTKNTVRASFYFYKSKDIFKIVL